MNHSYREKQEHILLFRNHEKEFVACTFTITRSIEDAREVGAQKILKPLNEKSTPLHDEESLWD